MKSVAGFQLTAAAEVRIPAVLADELEQLLRAGRRWSLLQQLCEQRLSSAPTPRTVLNLLKAREAQGLASQDGQLVSDALGFIAADFSPIRRAQALTLLRSLNPDRSLAPLLQSLDHDSSKDFLAWLSAALGRQRRWAQLAQLHARHLSSAPGLGTKERLARALRLAGEDSSIAPLFALLRGNREAASWMGRWLVEQRRWLQLSEWRACELTGNPQDLRLRQQLSRALALLPRNQSLVQVLRAVEQSEAALAVLSRMLARRLPQPHLIQLRALELAASPDSQLAKERFARALQATDSSADLSPVYKLLEASEAASRWVGRWMAERGRWAQLCAWRAAELAGSPSSSERRARLAAALKRLDPESPMTGVIDGLASSAQAMAWIYPLIKRMDRPTELARLLERQVALDPGRPLYWTKWLDALLEAGAEDLWREAARKAIQAVTDPVLLSSIAKHSLARKAWLLLSEVRVAQLRAHPEKIELVSLHTKVLRQHAPDVLTPFFGMVAALPWTDERLRDAMRGVLVRERAWAALGAHLNACLEREPQDTDSLLASAELAEIQGNEERARDFRRTAREVLLRRSPADALPLVEIRAECVKVCAEAWSSVLAKESLEFAPSRLGPLIEHLAVRTQNIGRLPIWEGYRTADIKSNSRERAPNDIRVARRFGEFLAWLTRARQPNRVLEIGTGFGVSGMYWLSGLEENSRGELVTFEANPQWQQIAARNLAEVSPRHTSICGAFEESFLDLQERSVDIAFVDAIHTPEAVENQLSILRQFLCSGALVLIDDIRFSEEMHEHWRIVAQRPEYRAAFEIEGRLGFLELA